MEPLAFCNLAVIGITCWFSYAGFRNPRFEEKWIFWPEAVLGGQQYYRLLTSGFLHADGQHLLLNMISLYLFGSQLEFAFGPLQFLTVFFSGIIGGNLLSLFLHRRHEYRAYGASGGVCGVIFANIFLFPGSSISMYFLPFGIPSWLYAPLFLVASFYGLKVKKDNIGHDAHLGGALVGLFVAAAFHPRAVLISPILFTVITGSTILMFLYFLKNPLFLPLSSFRSMKRSAPSVQGKSRLSERDLDTILEKISTQGLDSLTEEEQTLLRETSNKYNRRATSKKPDSELVL